MIKEASSETRNDTAPGEVLGQPVALDGLRPDHHVEKAEVITHTGAGTGRPDQPGGDGVDRDTVDPDFGGQCPNKADDAALAAT